MDIKLYHNSMEDLIKYMDGAKGIEWYKITKQMLIVLQEHGTVVIYAIYNKQSEQIVVLSRVADVTREYSVQSYSDTNYYHSYELTAFIEVNGVMFRSYNIGNVATLITSESNGWYEKLFCYSSLPSNSGEDILGIIYPHLYEKGTDGNPTLKNGVWERL